MNPTEILEDIIQQIDPEDVPVEFIVLARVTDMTGKEHTLKGKALEKVLRNPDQYRFREARVILNVKKMGEAIVDEMNDIFARLNRRFLTEE